jgi:hypothetical protein
MELNCEGCAGCCIDWRPVAGGVDLDHERRGPREPLDDVYNLVPLTRDEVCGFVDAGLGDGLVPRLWRADGEREAVTVDGVDVAAVDGRPACFVGLRKPPKPVAPFGLDRRWLRACAFLDPDTLQCRIHGDDLYPDERATYTGHNLRLDAETECERVETVHGAPGERLVDATPPTGTRGPLFGPQALGAKVFAHPDPENLGGAVGRLRDGTATVEDRARFVAVAAASAPGTLAVNDGKRAAARRAVRDADSWAGRAADVWTAAAGDPGDDAGDAPDATVVEAARGAPPTPGWDAVGGGEPEGDVAGGDRDARGGARDGGNG